MGARSAIPVGQLFQLQKPRESPRILIDVDANGVERFEAEGRRVALNGPAGDVVAHATGPVR